MRSSRRSEESRGCLHKLVVTNFKSYAGVLTLGPFKDFTCVIGPNGSGKSNLMDAVSFVVGVNTSQLRGAKISDFRTNLDTRTDAPTSVTLHYRGARQQGEKTPTETVFTRTITSQDNSEWRVDGRKVDSKEYQKRLKAVGLLVKPRNFLVFQNEVEAIASKSPKQLTELLERICGSEDLKEDYERLQNEKNEAAQSSVSVFKRSMLVTQERKLLKEQVKEATTYQELQEKLINLKVKRFLFDLFQIERQTAKIADEADAHASRLIECDANCKAMSKGHDKKSKEKSSKEKEWGNFDKKVQDLDKLMKKIENRDILKINESIDHKKHKCKNVEQELKTLQEKAQDAKKKKDPLEKQCKDLEKIQAKEKSKDEAGDFQASGNQVSKYNSLKTQKMALTSKAQAELDRTSRDHSTDQIEEKKLECEINSLKSKIESSEERQKQKSADKVASEKKIAELTEKEHKSKSELKDVEKNLSDWSAQHKVLLEKTAELSNKLADAKVDERFARSEEEKQKVVDHLITSFQGVHGRVMDLCKVKQRVHELAITVVLEGNMDSIVVEREETAKRCVEYLREQKHRAITFLPLDSIKCTPPEERLRMIPGAKLALDLIDFDKQYEKVMWHVTANTVVVNTLDDAKRLAFGPNPARCKIVTLDASTISKSGVMTGGDASHLTSKAKRWQNQEFERLRETLEANNKELHSLKNKIEQAKKQKSTLERDNSQMSHQLSIQKTHKRDSEASCGTLQRELEIHKGLILEKERALEVVRLRMKSREDQLQKQKDELNRIESEVFRDFCAELKIKHISEFEGGSYQQHKERIDRSMQLQQQIGKLNAMIQKLRDTEKLASEQEQEKLNEVEKLKKEIEGLRGEKAAKDKEIEEAKKEKAVEEMNRQRFKRELDELDKELKNISQAMRKIQDERDEVQRLVERAESRMEGLRSQRKSIVEQCAIDEIPLPKKNGHGIEGDDDDVQMESTCSHSQSAIDAKAEIATDRYDYSRLPRDHRRELAEKDQSKVRSQFEEEQNKLVEVINSMNPNMKAMDQLKEVEVRYTAVMEETKVAKEKSQDLTRQFDDVKQKRCELFNSCFDHVKGCIDGIYKELTSDRSQHSVGGSAYLTLNNQDEPYLDGIKYDTIPPGKRFMEMQHLSGGEKTVAALALLFSINSFSPAPFIVLDEVDAALDARNVARVTRYILSRRLEQQCIIISLKERFYETADALVGICRDISGGHSRVFTLDLTAYGAAA